MKKDEISMQVINPHAAGIDVGSREHFVAVGQRSEDVKSFGVMLKTYQHCAIGCWTIISIQWPWNLLAPTGKIYSLS